MQRQLDPAVLDAPSYGVLVAVVGADGVGKTTLLDNLKAIHEGRDDVVFTREPYDRERIKPLFDAGEVTVDTFTEDRQAHWREVIQPALDADKIVITDRYWMCTAVYQVEGDGEDALAGAQDIVNDQRDRFGEPHVVVHLSLDPMARSERLHDRGDGHEVPRSNRVARLYEDVLPMLNHSLVYVINASESPQRVCNRVVSALNLAISMSPSVWSARGL